MPRRLSRFANNVWRRRLTLELLERRDVRAVATGDFNSDGRPDLVMTNYVSSGTVTVLIAKSNGTFNPPQNFAVGAGPSDVIVGDFNVDGRLDLAVANEGSSSISVWRGTGTP